MTDDPIASVFDSGLERYKAGEGPETLIPYFKDICDRAPKMSPAWSCLAWLYMLDNQPEKAYKAAQKAVKLDATDAQTRVNMAMTLLETKQKGVREHIEIAQQIMAADSEFRSQVEESIAEGLTRKPDWESLKRVQNWLFAS